MATIHPKVCAVCYIVMDRYQGQWVHAREVAGFKDHIAVPVDYDDERVRTMCDFCFDEVPKLDILTVPASDFEMPIIKAASLGAWAACQVCGTLVAKPAWEELVDRAADYYILRHGESMPREFLHEWLTLVYQKLSHHMTGPVRQWAPGDEKVEA